MNPSASGNEEEIIHIAAGLSPDKRSAYLENVCAGDAALLSRIKALFESHATMVGGAPLGTRIEAGLAGLRSEKAHDRIGHYRLLQQIGEGGFGTVWMAEQERPVQRRVAIKIIKLGMDTREVIARFEQERQALAMMDHPNIAKVFDAGATEFGRPFFVMELVRGIRITDYCDKQRLAMRKRLELFMTVCHAVQHAHQKGIIHRDLKPSNVLVTLDEGGPVAKVIDFGVAKATQARLTDMTLFTQVDQMIGTPLYMSPEQAEMSALDIDTRSDIYSLGVLLYELLSGRTPFDPEELRKAGCDEIRRLIREREPPRPSTAFSAMAKETLSRVAQQRQSDPPKLIGLLRGDLDWIVMKCLEKDRTRRYETTNGLAMDVKRHLDNEPVLARPPSTAYRLQKLVRRNKLAVGAAAAVATALLIAAVAGVFAWRSQVAQQRSLAAQRQMAMEKAFLAAHTGDFEETNRAIAEAELGGASPGEARMLRGYLALHRGDYPEARRELGQAVKLQSESVAALSLLTTAMYQTGENLEFDLNYEAVQRLSPRTPEDFLFKGLLEAEVDPIRSLTTLNEAVHRRPSAIARLGRANARAEFASLTATVADAELALADAGIAKELLPNNPIALSTDLIACDVAIGIYLDAGKISKADETLVRANTDAQALGNHPRHEDAVLARAQHFATILDDEAAALEELGRAFAELQSKEVDTFYADLLFRRGENGKAKEVLERRVGITFAALIGIFVLMDVPDGPDRAMEHYRQFWAGNPPPTPGMYALAVPLLLGRKADAVDGFRQLRDRPSLKSPHRNGWFLRLMEFGCERLTEDELLKAAGDSRWNQCEAYFFLGLTRLGEGDRATARVHFQKSVATRVFTFFDYRSSRAFLARLDKDPNWPPWIPVGKPGANGTNPTEPESVRRQ